MSLENAKDNYVRVATENGHAVDPDTILAVVETTKKFYLVQRLPNNHIELKTYYIDINDYPNVYSDDDIQQCFSVLDTIITSV